MMLSLPDNWEFSLKGLVTLSPDGISSVRSALKELENHNYFKRRRLHENGKLAGVEYIVAETPMCENLILENLKQENLKLEKPPQLNTNNNKVSKESNIYRDVPEEIKEAFMDWVAMRKKMKRPITTKRAVTMALNALNKLSTDPEKQNELINFAIYKSWLSFYPIPKEEKQGKRYKEFEKEEKVKGVVMTEEQRKQMNKTLGRIGKE